MDLKSGHPYFFLKNGLGPDYGSLRADLTTEVVILGGGISGALMAHVLFEQGIPCVVIDKRTIGLGSTSASTSLLQYEIDVPLYNLSRHIGKDSAFLAYRLCASAIDRIGEIAAEVGYRDFTRSESLYFSDSKASSEFLRKEFDIRREAGFDVEYLGREAILNRYGISSGGAILSTKAAKVDAYLLTHVLHAHNIRRGLQVFENSCVDRIKETVSGVELLTDTGYKVRAGRIVYATGYEVTEQISRSIVKLRSTYAFVSEHLEQIPAFMENTVMWNTSDPYLYIREDRGRLIAGGRDEDYYNPAKRDALIEKKTKQLEKDVKALFPDLQFRSQFSWAGTFGSTKDGLPYIGVCPGKPYSYFALGFGGNGITFSVLAADYIAKEIREQNNHVPEIFRFNR